MTLSAHTIHFSYHRRQVLHDISFSMDKGEILAIVGPNGSGKSTLAKCIAGILSPDGAVYLGDRDAAALRQRERARRIGYLPQSTASHFPVSVFDAVLMGRRPHASWRSGAGDHATVWRALDLLGLRPHAQRDFHCLSGGEQQRVLLARAIAQEAELLILDEPTSSLDIRHQLGVMDAVRRLADRQRLSVLMVVHDLNLAARYADRIALMGPGRLQAIGKPEEVLTAENIAGVYGVTARVWNDNGNLFVAATGLARA
jgi:iron complex transport system ATP-binding protein